MQHKLVRIAIGVPEGFIALSAIGGGILMLADTYQDGVLIEAGGRGQFPLEWLHNTPFSDYTIPALILAIGVGGSSLIGAVMVFTGRKIGVLASVVAGLIMAGYIVVEVVMLKQGVSWIEDLYCGPGLLISGLATSLWMAEDCRLREQPEPCQHARSFPDGTSSVDDHCCIRARYLETVPSSQRRLSV